jgi:lipid kinase YegS
MRLILNGKKAELPEVREAVYKLRDEGYEIGVRVTWEKGDMERYVHEAVQDGQTRIVAGGGDGSINEAVNALMSIEADKRPALGILPLGTANDFATAAEVPFLPYEALKLALEGEAYKVDVVRANERYFVNVASSGFGAQVVAETPPSLKNFLGGGAYTLSAVIKALNFTAHEGRLVAEGVDIKGRSIAGVVCNGRQAGGGQMLAPYAFIDDGFIDIVVILEFPLIDLGQVLSELYDYNRSGTYVKRYRKTWVESYAERKAPVNLDGEPYMAEHIRFEVVPEALRMVLPHYCPMLSRFAV